MSNDSVCSTCGEAIAADARFCSVCATPVDLAPEIIVASEPTETTEPAEPIETTECAVTSEPTEATEPAVANETTKPSVANETTKPSVSGVAEITTQRDLANLSVVESPFPELHLYSAEAKSQPAPEELKKGDLSVSENCSVCKNFVELEDVVYCSECGCVSHLSCWKKHHGCGEEYCHSFEGFIMVVAEGAGAGGNSRYKLHGDGSIELIHHLKGVEQKFLIASIVFVFMFLIPANGLSFLLTPLAVLGFLGSLGGYRATERGLREHLMIQGPSNSMSTEKRFFSRRFKGKERFRFKEDIVEVHLQYLNTTIEQCESYQRLLARNKNATIPSVRFQCRLLTIEDEYIDLFTEKSRLINDVIKVAGQIALALDVPLRKMGKGPPLTSQERKRLIGQHVGDGL